MRDEYYRILNEYNFNDVLQEINEFSYSRKIKTLNKLLERYNPVIANKALNLYKSNYIDTGRIDIRFIDKVILGLCKYIQKKEETK